MRTIQEVVIGEEVTHPSKGKGVIIGKTPRTITAKFKVSTSKVTYRHNDAYFYASDL